jgi:hypothetical protein
VKENGQFSLFGNGVTSPPESVEEKPVLDELRDLDIANLTPVEALVKLDAWKRKLDERSRHGAE